MKFGEVPVVEAEGAILAHSLKLGTAALKKGRVLSAADLELINAAGLASVTVARLEAGDVGEDQAAERVAAAAVGPGVSAAAPFTGRVNLHAEEKGVLVFDPRLLDAAGIVERSPAAPVHGHLSRLDALQHKGDPAESVEAVDSRQRQHLGSIHVAIGPGEARTACAFTGSETSVPADAVLLVTARLPRDGVFLALQERQADWPAHGVRSVTCAGDAWAPATIASAAPRSPGDRKGTL